MSEAVIDDIVAVLPPLLESLDALAYVARHLHPPVFGRVMQDVGAPDEALQAVRPRLDMWSPQFAQVGTALKAASDATLAAFAGLRQVEQGQGDLVAVFRALRHNARAQEALYPLAEKFPPVSDFFLDPSVREDANFKSRFEQPAANATGVFHFDNEPGSRGGFSL
jgi:phospholipase/carboxylesterase